MYMMHLESRRQFGLERVTETFAANLARLCGQDGPEAAAHPDTLARYARELPADALAELPARLVAALIRKRCLDPFRLRGKFMVAIDGSRMHTFREAPWEGCPSTRLPDGSVRYHAHTLDAKVVSPCGLALTVASEFLDNGPDGSFDKQDCELRAFRRLLPRLRGLFPRTPLLLLLDGLYASAPDIALILACRFSYMITFKKGSMPERFAEAEALAALDPGSRLVVRADGGIQTFRWVSGLPLGGPGDGLASHVLFCDEEAGGRSRRFVWLTDLPLSARNAEETANRGGRQRWKVENQGYLVQKRRGYGMEHVYCGHPNGFRVFYILLVIAHMISQLILHGSLIRDLARTFGSARNFARRLAESLRNRLAPENLPLPGQIRFKPP